VGVLFLIIGSLNLKKIADQRAATIMNDVILVLIFIISFVNIIISSFGMEYSSNPLKLVHDYDRSTGAMREY